MTLNEVLEMLNCVKQQGKGDQKVQIWDPDSDRWETVTGCTYGEFGDAKIRLFSDSEEESDE